MAVEATSGAPDYAAPPPKTHHRFGESDGQWAYRDASGFITSWAYRYLYNDSVKWQYFTWADGTWYHQPPAKPRPLYQLDQLLKHPKRTVLVVHHEPQADVAQQHFSGMVVTTWLGDPQAANMADWAVLEGRDCVLWFPNEDQGRIACTRVAGFLLSLKASVRSVDSSDDPADLWERPTDQVKAWAKQHIKPVERAIDAAPPVVSLPTPAIIVDDPDTREPSGHTLGKVLDLQAAHNGVPFAHIANAVVCIDYRAQKSGVQLWYDEFLQEIRWQEAGEKSQKWADVDTVNLTAWMQKALQLHRATPNMVRDAVLSYAFAHKRNECREWLQSLIWDGTDRLTHLLPAGFGAIRNEYSEAVGRCFIMSIVARVLRPGCQVDTVPVFEGAQGTFKSSALRIIGGQYFSEIGEKIGTKDFLQAIQGKMLLEISELNSFKRSEVETIKSVISNRSDRYRASYGRETADHPRQCVFAGTSNRSDWQVDDTGARRFWPVLCGEIDLDWLSESRTQLFAEARTRVERGEPWHDVPSALALLEQQSRDPGDVWDDAVAGYILGREQVTVHEVLTFGVGRELPDISRADEQRAGAILRRLGLERSLVRVDGQPRRVWRLPQKKTPST